jgi:hypothetical protein
MEVNGQLHALTALPPGERGPVPIVYDAGWAPEPVCGFCGIQINPLALPGIEARPATILAELSRALKFKIWTSQNATDIDTTFCPC